MAQPKTVARHKLLGITAMTSLLLGFLLSACGDDSASQLVLPTTSAANGTANPNPTGSTTSPGAITPTSSPTSATTSAATTRAAVASAVAGNTPADNSSIFLPSQPAQPPAQGTTRPQVSPHPSPTARPAIKPVTGYPGKLSLIGEGDLLYISRFDGNPPQQVLGNKVDPAGVNKNGTIVQWPTWSKDGNKLAVMSYNIQGGNLMDSDVFVVGADGKNPTKLQGGLAAQPVYISWSPDGNLLSLLLTGAATGAANSLELRLIDASATATNAASRKITEGSSIYTGWSPDSQQLLIHTNTSATASNVALLSAKDKQSQAVVVKPNAGAFRAPAFSADSARLAVVTRNATTNTEEIEIDDSKGTALGKIEVSGRNIILGWSPSESRLAYSFLSQGSTTTLNGIYLSDVLGGSPAGGKFTSAPAVTENVLAFFWAPDGKKIAYLGINAQTRLLVWNLYELDTKKTTPLVEWYPSDAWVQMIQFFDQYAQNNSIWSPDSKSLIFSGLTKEEINQVIAGSAALEDFKPYIYILPIEGAAKGGLVPVAAGEMAFWSK